MLNHETLLLGGKKALGIPFAMRMNALDSAKLSRTQTSVATDSKAGTFSTWLKRGNLGITTAMFGTTKAGGGDQFRFNSTDKFRFFTDAAGAGQSNLITAAVFRDPAAWYHIVLALDSAQATPSNRVKIYVNGLQLTAFDTETYPNQNTGFDTWAANTEVNNIGATGGGGGANFLDGYIAETVFVDGQALAPTDFGEFAANTGEWVPKKYAGTFGNNGFRLDYGDAADLGNDVSGNANDFTSSGLTSADQVADTPTNNYPTLASNGVPAQLPGTLYAVLSDGNLHAAVTGGHGAHGTLAIPANSGKWSFQGIATHASRARLGVLNINSDGTEYVDYASNTGDKRINGTITSYGASYTTGDVIEVQLDTDAGTVVFRKNGVSQGTITGLNTTDADWVAFFEGNATGDAIDLDFGQLGYTPSDSAFKTLNTTNLLEPSIILPSAYFTPLIYTGDGTNGRAVTGVNFQTDLLWIKKRSAAESHNVVDSVRGVGFNLATDTLAVEDTASRVVSLDADGFTVDASGRTNENAKTYVAWNWKEGAIPGFDIKSYTGNGGTQTPSHDLGVKPDLIITKNRDSAVRWTVYHSAIGAAQYGYLNEALAFNTGNANLRWGNNSTTVEPTASVFTIGNSTDVNQNTNDYIAYLFAEIEGFSKFGSYIGNASADGPFVWCGFRPAFVMIKEAPSTGHWLMYDSARSSENATNDHQFANLSGVDGTSARDIDILSNGFKVRSSDADMNSAVNYLFIAFAEAPFKYANAR